MIREEKIKILFAMQPISRTVIIEQNQDGSWEHDGVSRSEEEIRIIAKIFGGRFVLIENPYVTE